jgi:hypothetical protein
LSAFPTDHGLRAHGIGSFGYFRAQAVGIRIADVSQRTTMHPMTKDIAFVSIIFSGLASGCGDGGDGGSDVQACYSPTANVSTADQVGAKGCACNSAVDTAVCVQGKALFCDYDHWSLGYDGPCMPPRDGGSSQDLPSGNLGDVGAGDLPSGDLGDVGTVEFTCGKPSCCVPIAIASSRVYVYRNSDGGRVAMVLNLGTPPSNWWEIDVDLLLPSGTSVSCSSSVRAPALDSKTVTIFCPTVSPDALPACDSTLTLELHPHSSTYPDSTGTQALCAGTEGRQVKLSVPVLCPASCGYVSYGSSCSVLGQTCSYTTMGYGGAGGTMVSLPCNCDWSDYLNGLAWSCPVP